MADPRPGLQRTALIVSGLSRRTDHIATHLEDVVLPALKILRRRLRIVACCARDKKVAALLAAFFPESRIYPDHRSLWLEKKSEHKPQIAVVAGAADRHYEICESALLAGTNLYCATALTDNPRDDLDLFHLACRNNLLTGSANQYRHVPGIERARKLASGGYIGLPLFFSMSLFDDSRVRGGGDNRRDAVRNESFARSSERIAWITGLDIEAVHAFAGAVPPDSGAGGRRRVRRPGLAPEVGSYFLRLADGTKGALQVCGACPPGSGERLELYGTEGMLLLTRPAQRPFDYHLTGARVDVGDILKRATPPEKLKRKFRPFRIASTGLAVSGTHAGKPWFGEALALSAFARAVQMGSEHAPGLLDRYRLGCVLAAADKAASSGAWTPVDYASSGASAGPVAP